MTLIPIDQTNFEKFTIIAHPLREFVSSSNGVTGSVKLFPAGSKIEKESGVVFNEDVFQDDSRIDDMLRLAHDAGIASGSNLQQIEKYLQEVNIRGEAKKNKTELLIRRFKPGTDFSRDYMTKNVIRKNLMTFYSSEMTNPNWSFSNYNCLNFFTSSQNPTNHALVFAGSLRSITPISASSLSSVSTTYIPTGSFCFDFWIKPDYTNDIGGEFETGCIMHVSSSYAVSLASGSVKNAYGQAQTFKLQLQLLEGAEVNPIEAEPGDFTYRSLTELPINKWSHVAISWGTESKNEGTGTFYINGEPGGNFLLPSQSLNAVYDSGQYGQPLLLSVGNWWQGPNSGSASQNILFDQDIEEREGLLAAASAFNQDGIPSEGDYVAPLNAKISELTIYNSWRSQDQISESMFRGITPDEDTLFYLPPFFTKESPFRKLHNFDGGVLQTPFFASDGVTDDPYNTSLAFGVDGFYPNLENWGRDFANGVYGRWVNMSSSISPVTSSTRTANEYLGDFPGYFARKNMIFPNDNGEFLPNYSLLITGTYTFTPDSSHEMSKFVDSYGQLDLSQIDLSKFIDEDALFGVVAHGETSPLKDIQGPTPEEFGVAPGKTLSIFERVRDSSSNQIVLFDINSIYYGSKIQPGSFKVTDPAMSGSGGKISCVICDDEYGGLYVQTQEGKSEFRNIVGNIFYNEGLVVIYHPTLKDFGENGYEMSFRGEQRIQVMKVSVDAPSGKINSSSHINYIEVPYNNNVNEAEQKFVYISDIAFLDKDLNVLMKTHLAQPVKKRSSDDFQFKTKLDL